MPAQSIGLLYCLFLLSYLDKCMRRLAMVLNVLELQILRDQGCIEQHIIKSYALIFFKKVLNSTKSVYLACNQGHQFKCYIAPIYLNMVLYCTLIPLKNCRRTITGSL